MAETQQLENGTPDPNVIIPKHILAAAAAADAIHKQVYEQPQQPEPQPEPPAPAVELPPVEAASPQQPEPPPAAPAPPPPSKDGTKESNENHESWHHAYLSMQGRWQSAQRQLGEKDEMLSQMATELQATQNLLTQQPRQEPAQQQPTHEKLITDQDIEAYSPQMIDVMQRAAREAVQPELDALRGENAELKKRVISTAQRDVQVSLASAIPNWVEINRSREFSDWLNKRNLYTGQVRRQMLNDAYRAANAAVVVQTFKDFLMEVKATGATPPASQRQQQEPSPAPAPRQPAMQLEALAAPGKARPAPGQSDVPADKPIYSHAQIAKFYDEVRRGAYAGRQAEKAALEADIFRAQSEGRVR